MSTQTAIADTAAATEAATTGAAATTDELAELVARYETYLRGQRGLSDNTVRVYRDDLDSFLRYMALAGCSLADMKPAAGPQLSGLAGYRGPGDGTPLFGPQTKRGICPGQHHPQADRPAFLLPVSGVAGDVQAQPGAFGPQLASKNGKTPALLYRQTGGGASAGNPGHG